MSRIKTNKFINNTNNSHIKMFKTQTNLLTNISLNLNINNNPKTTSRNNINKFNNLQFSKLIYDFNK